MNLENFYKSVESTTPSRSFGNVIQVGRESVRVSVPRVKVGSLCAVQGDGRSILLEIVSLDKSGHVAMPMDDLQGVRLGDRVHMLEETSLIKVGSALLGRTIDSHCTPYDEGPLYLPDARRLYGVPNNPMHRELIKEPLDLGVRAINACLTCGLGQRQGIFAGSGVGKSVLLGMMARHTAADVVVIALIGERGREVKEFIKRELGPEGLKKSVVVVETAEKSPVRRTRGAYVATAIAEYFRDQGANVLLMMDSLTRFAMAQREIGLAAGEPPTTKGYPASVYSALSKLTERAGNWGRVGSITGLYTVLVEGDDLDDPIADASRAILDGHIILSRKLANRGRYPAIDILSSVSRVMDQVTSKEHQKMSQMCKRLLSRYEENEDAITLGVYERGSDVALDECIQMYPRISQLIQQVREDKANFSDSISKLSDLFKGAPGDPGPL